MIKKNSSIRKKLKVIMICILILIMVLFFTLFSIFLPTYSFFEEKNSLTNLFFQLDVTDISNYSDLIKEIKISEYYNRLNFYISENGKTIYKTGNELNKNIEEVHDIRVNYMNTQRKNYPKYIIKKVRDNKMNYYYLHLIFNVKIDNEIYTIIMEKGLSNLNMRNILFFVFLCMIPVSVLSLYMINSLGNFFINPILKLVKKSEQMANMDFSKKITEIPNDEIGILSKSMNKLAETIEQKIGELNKQNEKLNQNLIEKKNDEKMRKELISNVSHELKTPITVILGYAEALKLNLNTKEKSKYCQIIINESKRMNNMVCDILDIAKLQSDNINLNIEIISIKNIVENLLEKYSLLFKEKNIDCKLICKEDFILKADKSKIETVIDNFITNCLRYTTGDNKKVIIEISREKFSIYNTCKNLSEEYLKHLWDSFYKVDKARSRKLGGSGLGLYVVKTILDLHGIGYGVLNKPGGLEFYFERKKN